MTFKNADDLTSKIDDIYARLDEDESGGLTFKEFRMGLKQFSSHIHMTREDFDIVTENGKHLGATNEFNREQFQTMMKKELWRYSRRELANVQSVSGDEQFNSTILMLKMMESEVLQLLYSIEHHVTADPYRQRQSAVTGHPSLPRSKSGGTGGEGLGGEGGDVLFGRGAVRWEGRAEGERLDEVLRKLEGLGEVSQKLSNNMDRMSERMDGMSEAIDRLPVKVEHQIMRRLGKRLQATSAIRQEDGTVVEADIVSASSTPSSKAPKSEWAQTLAQTQPSPEPPPRRTHTPNASAVERLKHVLNKERPKDPDLAATVNRGSASRGGGAGKDSIAPKSGLHQAHQGRSSSEPTAHAAMPRVLASPRVLPLSRRSERMEGGRGNGVDSELTHSRSESLARQQVSLFRALSLSLSLSRSRSHSPTHCCTQDQGSPLGLDAQNVPESHDLQAPRGSKHVHPGGGAETNAMQALAQQIVALRSENVALHEQLTSTRSELADAGRTAPTVSEYLSLQATKQTSHTRLNIYYIYYIYYIYIYTYIQYTHTHTHTHTRTHTHTHTQIRRTQGRRGREREDHWTRPTQFRPTFTKESTQIRSMKEAHTPMSANGHDKRPVPEILALRESRSKQSSSSASGHDQRHVPEILRSR